jgi:uncharacterized protein (DUF1778 family)
MVSRQPTAIWEEGQNMPRTASKHARIGVRVDPELKYLVERAAAMQGRSMTDFIEDSLRASVADAFRKEQIILSARDTAILAEAILNPAEPNDFLRDAMRLHRESVVVQ